MARKPLFKRLALTFVILLFAGTAGGAIVYFITSMLSSSPCIAGYIATSVWMSAPRVRPFCVRHPNGWPSVEAYLADLAATLKRIHVYQQHPAHQSLRGGAQTLQNLTGSSEPTIKAFFAAIDAPIRKHMPDVPEQLATWPAATGWNVGSVVRHTSRTSVQRGANAQPGGSRARLGGAPAMGTSGRPFWPRRTVAPISPPVYGCAGRS